VKCREFEVRRKLSISKNKGQKVISEVKGIRSTEETEYFQEQGVESDE
jgi:hypothetical protein